MDTINRKNITDTHWKNASTYPVYREHIEALLKTNKTTGNDHSEKMIEYSQLNLKRMKKWDKITTLSEPLLGALKNIKQKQKWLVLTEAWCGDAAQNLPVLHKIAESHPLIEMRVLLRDENLDVMDQYLTNGGRSIPKLIIMDDALNPLATWDPRPDPAQQLFLKYKEEQTLTYDGFALTLHAWYGKDRTKSLQDEFVPLLNGLT